MNRTLIAGGALLIALGLLRAQTTEELAAYLLVTSAAMVPGVLWLRAGTPGVPVLPTVSVFFFVCYAVPILSHENVIGYAPSEILRANATVALFLGSATLSWWLLLSWRADRSHSAAQEPISGAPLRRIIFLGLALGTFYYIALYSGWLSWLGASFGLVRSVTLTGATVACFMVGHARAQGLLRGRRWALAVAGFSIFVLLSCMSLYLYGAIGFCMAAVFGYVITGKRVPWVLLSAAATVVMVLHAGKDEMRTKYWGTQGTNFNAEISLTQVPGLMAEWLEMGMAKLTSSDSYGSALGRASLIQMLLRAQRLTPDYVPFLEGKTYALLPAMLVPRFLEPNKITSQAAMKMLNIHYGLQTIKESEETAIGWGLVAEAYANFGYLGVIGVALLLGVFSGLFERWSDGVRVVSLPTLLAITVMMQLIILESDSALLVTSLWVNVVAASFFFWLFRLFPKQEKRLSQYASPSLRTVRPTAD